MRIQLQLEINYNDGDVCSFFVLTTPFYFVNLQNKNIGAIFDATQLCKAFSWNALFTRTQTLGNKRKKRSLYFTLLREIFYFTSLEKKIPFLFHPPKLL